MSVLAATTHRMHLYWETVSHVATAFDRAPAQFVDQCERRFRTRFGQRVGDSERASWERNWPALFDMICNQRHLLHALRKYERFYNNHRPHQGIANARPLRPLPSPITGQTEITDLDIRRRPRLGGILNEYHHTA
jgi:hypothetical protein